MSMTKFLFLLVAILGVSPVFAQMDGFGPIEKEKKSVFFVGPKVGVTITSMTQPDECNLYDATGIGFSGGIAMKARFGRASENSLEGTGIVGVGLELKYKQSSVKTISEDNLSLGYFEVPVTLQFYPFTKSNVMNNFYIEVGVAGGLLISKKPDVLTVNSPNANLDYVKYSTGDLKGGDFHPVVGLGYTIPGTGFDINARYNIGTSKLAENFPCKMSAIEVSVSWLFKAAKF